ncbi:MAG TPA: hypothetical protein VHP37_10670 [Burkholderiales bacterium]|nr:hypothetical protein [Burkholderiales bacterium]
MKTARIIAALGRAFRADQADGDEGAVMRGKVTGELARSLFATALPVTVFRHFFPTEKELTVG